MANFIDSRLETLKPSPKGTAGSTLADPPKIQEPVFKVAEPGARVESEEAFIEQPAPKRSLTLALLTGAVVIVALALFGFFLLKFNSGTASTAAKPIAAVQPAPAQPAQLSASDIKEMKARDDYAAKLSTTLHQRLPAYKSVKIYADSWTGKKAPALVPLTDVKLRKGDNLMMVFWSPEAGTARGLADFAKSPAAQQAVNAGFAEFQFIDPDTYCYSLVVPVTGAAPVACGIR